MVTASSSKISEFLLTKLHLLSHLLGNFWISYSSNMRTATKDFSNCPLLRWRERESVGSNQWSWGDSGNTVSDLMAVADNLLNFDTLLDSRCFGEIDHGYGALVLFDTGGEKRLTREGALLKRWKNGGRRSMDPLPTVVEVLIYPLVGCVRTKTMSANWRKWSKSWNWKNRIGILEKYWKGEILLLTPVIFLWLVVYHRY